MEMGTEGDGHTIVETIKLNNATPTPASSISPRHERCRTGSKEAFVQDGIIKDLLLKQHEQNLARHDKLETMIDRLLSQKVEWPMTPALNRPSRSDGPRLQTDDSSQGVGALVLSVLPGAVADSSTTPTAWTDQSKAKPAQIDPTLEVDKPPGTPAGGASNVDIPTSTKSTTTARDKKLLATAGLACTAGTAAATGSIEALLNDTRCETFIGFVIMANAFFIGIDVQVRATRASRGEHEQLMFVPVLDTIFLGIFVLEFALRIFVEKGDFLRAINPHRRWNIFDTVIVPTSLIQWIVEMLSSESLDIPALRVLRIFRMAKVMRMVRAVRLFDVFRELRIMLLGIMRSLQSLVCTVFLLLLCFYIFGICLSDGVIDYLNETAGWNNADEDIFALQETFGTLDASVLSLFKSMSGGVDWGDCLSLLRPLPFFYSGVFIVFIIFAVFVLVNVITGVFVENAMHAAHADRETLISERRHEMEQYIKSMTMLFQEMDKDETDCITFDEFEGFLSNQRVQDYFAAVKLDVTDSKVKALFRLMDSNMNGSVEIQEFLLGCRRLGGESRALDLAVMDLEVKWLVTHVQGLTDAITRLIAQPPVASLSSSPTAGAGLMSPLSNTSSIT
jgi:hypothetical protein